MRSRIRRQHLISLGIPVNLDEVLPHAGSKPLPALHITTRPMSAPPVPRNGAQPLNGRASSNTSRAGTPVAGAPASGNSRRGAAAQLGLGPKPQLDERRIGELLSLTPGMCLVIYRNLCSPHCRSTIPSTSGVLGGLPVRLAHSNAKYVSAINTLAADQGRTAARLGDL
jgi:hypothetical protein